MNQDKSSVKHVLFNSGVYAFTSVLQKAVSFILLPVYTLYLTPNDYGIVGIVNSLTILLTQAYTLSLNASVQRYYYKYKTDKFKLKTFNSTIIVFVLCNSVILSIVLVLFRNFIITPFVDGIEFYPYIFMGILTVIFNPIYTIYQSLLQTMQKAKEYGLNSLMHFVLTVFLNILFIVFFKLGATGQLLSYLITAIIFGAFSLFSLYKREIIDFDFDYKYLKEALKYSIPLLPHQMSTSIASFISRIFLNNLVSTGSAGLFNIASQLMLVVDTIQISLNNAYVPWFYNEMSQDPRNESAIIKLSDLMSRVYLIISIGLSYFIKEIIYLFLPASYLQAWQLIPIIVIAYQFKSIYLFYVNTLFYNTSATRYIFTASVTGSLVNILVTSMLTSTLGLFTPAIAILIQWVVTSIIVILLSRSIEPVNFKLNKMLLYVIILVIAIFLGQHRDFVDPLDVISIYHVLYKLLLFLIIAFIIFYRDLPYVWSEVVKIWEKIKN